MTKETGSMLSDVRQQFDLMTDQFKAALPKHIPVERFTRVVMTAIQNNVDLLAAPRKELWNASMKAAQDGLLPDGREGALVLRKGRKGMTITWQPMIAGVRKKARNSGEIATWDAHVVHENDYFQFQLGDAPQINHSYDLKTPRGSIIGAYSVALLKDGTKSYEVMSIDEINTIRDRSDGWRAYQSGVIKSTPWASDYSEMARKTVAKRHSKVLPMSTDLDDLMRRDDELYDMAGASDRQIENERPKGLSARLDALVGERGDDTGAPSAVTDVDPDTGEVIDDSLDKGAAEAADPSTVAIAGDGAKPVTPSPADARKAGSEARAKNVSRKAVPAHFREDEILLSAWLDGFDTGDGDDREPGEEG